MSRLLTLLRTAWDLGLSSITRVMVYRTLLRLGLHPVQRLNGVAPLGPFFFPVAPGLPPVDVPSVQDWQDMAHLFGRWPMRLQETPPDWHVNPLSGQRLHDSGRPWWLIPDFEPQIGDIKQIWELSRLDWVLAWAQCARQGDVQALVRLNAWLDDWSRNNPPYLGPNWKCGQEASIRIIHLAIAALLLGQVDQPTPALREMVRLHLRRIAPTMSYAVGQDNNHGTSEAAALFIGGSWLRALGDFEGERWATVGRHWLENRVSHLVAVDGSFSQYSLNYHRVLLDTCSMVEVWRQKLDIPAFSEGLRERLQAATLWLQSMLDADSGDGPNLGANDGARLLQLTNTPYRDFRPSVQLAMALFAGQRAYAESGVWDHGLIWLGLIPPKQTAKPSGSMQADDGGFAILRRGTCMTLLRYPRFRFRPSQADALHLDFWHCGKNLLRDAGSYSYHTEAQWLFYFAGTAGHNTVQFDDHDQMPRLGRFLFGDWLRTIRVEPLQERADGLHVVAGYQNRVGNSHCRSVHLGDEGLHVMDEIKGFTHKAVLRWRLAPGSWKVDGVGVTDGRQALRVQADMPIERCELVEGWESRHYLEKTPLPVLEVEVHQPGILRTHFRWAA